MVSAGDFRNGVTFDMDGNVYQIIEFQHVKPGKGAAFVRTKIRNVITGAVTERTFNPSDKYPTAYIERKDMEYLYSDGDLYYFMDQETYENIPINKSILSDNFKFVKENTVCKILSYKGSVFGVEDAVYDAIWYHTTGKPDMTRLEKILYLADYIEPSRDFDGVETLRRAVYEDLDHGLLMGLSMTIQEMEEMGNPVHHLTRDARDYLLKRGIR